MTFNAAVGQATRNLIRSEGARTAKGETIQLEHVGDSLNVLTWGYESRSIEVQTTRAHMIGRKIRLQSFPRDIVEEVELRYIFDILRRESR